MSATTYRDHGIDAPDQGTGEHRTTCPECSRDRRKSGERCLSVNLDKHTWNCHHCGWTGGLPSEDTHPQRAVSPQERSQTRPAPELRPLSPEALAWLQARGISPQTAEAAGCREATVWFRDQNGHGKAIAFPYTVDGQPVGVKFRAIDGKSHSQTKGGCKHAWLHDLAVGSREIILTEGEPDTLAVMEAGYIAVVSCPEGAPPVNAKANGKLHFLESSADVFKGAERIILAMDADEVGIRFRDTIAEALGPERCLTVTYPAGCKDAGDVLRDHGRDALKACIRDAKPFPCPGLHTADEYEAALFARHSDPKPAGFSTGLHNLDALLRIEPGSLHVVTGIPGSGKSELLDGLALNTARLHGWRWLVFSPENHPVDRHLSKLAEKYMGKPFRSLSREELTSALAWIRERFVFVTEDDTGLTVDRLTSLLKSASARYGITGAIVDPWNELEHYRQPHTTESEYIGGALTQLRNVARREGIALFIAAHPTKMERHTDGEYGVPSPYDISGSAHWRNKADACLAIWRPMRAAEPWADIHVQKIRFRDVGKLGKCKLWWRTETGTYSDYMAGDRQ